MHARAKRGPAPEEESGPSPEEAFAAAPELYTAALDKLVERRYVGRGGAKRAAV